MMKKFKFLISSLLIGFIGFVSFGYCETGQDFDYTGSLNQDCQECEICPTTGEVLSGNVDVNYCVENDLCPVPSNFSQLFINDIEHETAPLINITIPEEFDWDYTVNSGLFEITIKGYNTDTEYIEGIINTQTSKPNNTDFNNIITYLMPLFVPGLVLILFLYFIFKFVKKIF